MFFLLKKSCMQAFCLAVLCFSGIPSPLLAQSNAPVQSDSADPARLHKADLEFRAGYAAVAKGDLKSAVRDFQAVVKLLPNVEEGHSALGAVLVELGRYSEAISELNRSLAMKPADSTALMNLAVAEADSGAYAKAIPLFEQLSKFGKSHRESASLPTDVAVAYARALAGIGRKEEAAGVLLQALERAPNRADIYDELGSIYAQEQEWVEAERAFTHAIQINPAYGPAHMHIGAAFLVTGKAQEALPELAQAAQLLPHSSQAQLELGEADIALGNDEQAVAALQTALQLNPNSVDAKYQLALALQGVGREKEAVPFFRQVAAARPDDNAAAINLALALVQTGDSKDAIGLYQQAVRRDPKNVTIYQDIAVAYIQQSDIDDAIKNLKAGLQLAPQDPQLHYDLGLAYKLKDDITDALAELQKSSTLDPSLPDPHYTLGILYMQEGHFSESEQELQTALHMRPKNADGWAILGSVYRQQNKLPQAVEALNESIRQQPDQPSGYITLASILAQQGNRAEAAADRKKAADLMRNAANRQRALFATNSGNSLRDKGDVVQAIERYQDAIRSDPKYQAAYLGLASAYEREGKSADAAAARRSAQSLQHPDR